MKMLTNDFGPGDIFSIDLQMVKVKDVGNNNWFEYFLDYF